MNVPFSDKEEVLIISRYEKDVLTLNSDNKEFERKNIELIEYNNELLGIVKDQVNRIISYN
ncbi:MAG: hypothetical protein PHY59_04290 [Methanobacterium sp.]|nr:hypothetical protein [Methanobacterium sp.]